MKIAKNGAITFAPGQTFPGVGTVTSVALSAPSSDFKVTGSPVTKSGTLSLNWNIFPTSLDVAYAIVKRDGIGGFSAHDITANSIFAFNPTGLAVFGVTNDTTLFGSGLEGSADGSTGTGSGVIGSSSSTTGLGVVGINNGTIGGQANSFIGTAALRVLGDSNGIGVLATSDNGQALVADNHSGSDTLVSLNKGTGAPLFVAGTGGSVFVDGNGNLTASGAINGSSKNFRIDHPLHPADKYLYHASVESSEMMNIYTGNAVLDASGEAAVQLPDWFEALNGHFRYQLTCIGTFAPVYVAQKITDHQFRIAGGQPGMEVSWQVTGVRQDAYAKAHRLVVEQAKPTGERGYYVHPELYGASKEKGLTWARHPGMMKQVKERKAQQTSSTKR